MLITELLLGGDLTACMDAGRQSIPAAPEVSQKPAGKPEQPKSTLKLLRADTVKIEPIRWIWPGFLASGKLHILGGAPGVGKSTVAVMFAAHVTTGAGWPDGHVSTPGSVIAWSGEDDPADTLVPRLIAAGADLRKIHFIERVAVEGAGNRPFLPAIDLPLLEEQIKAIGGAKLLIVDPIVSAITGDSHKNSEVRQSLQPLADLAVKHGIAVLGITHFSKNSSGREPHERITGSIAFTAFARIVLICSKQRDDDERIFCRAKSNIGLDEGGWKYSLAQKVLPCHSELVASGVQWGGRVEGSAREILAAAEAPDRDADNVGDAIAAATKFLLDVLGDGEEISAESVVAEAEANGISERTLNRAKAALKVKVIRKGFGKNGNFLWSLPTEHDSHRLPLIAKNSIDCHSKEVATYGKFGNLWSNPGSGVEVVKDENLKKEIANDVNIPNGQNEVFL